MSNPTFKVEPEFENKMNNASKNSMITDNEIISVKVAAARLDCHKNTVYHLIETGQLDAFRLTPGGKWKITGLAIDEFIQARQAKHEMRRQSLNTK